MKTKEELNALKNEVETLNKKLAELNEDELEQVIGGIDGYKTRKAQMDHWDLIFKDQAEVVGGAAEQLWDEASAGLITDPENPLP